MYNVFRKIHLYTGFILIIFVLMYFISGYIMIHHNNIVQHKDPKKYTRTERLNYTGEFDSEKFSKYLQNEFNPPSLF